MIVKDELLSKLRRYFDLNLYEVKLWTALLSRGVSTAGELSDIADVPRSRSYDVLESLEKKGFVIMKLGKPIKYIAIPPSEVVERVKKNMHTNAQKKIKRLDDVKVSPLLTELEIPIVVIAQDNSESISSGKDTAFYNGDYGKKMDELMGMLSEDHEVKTYSFGEQVREGLPLDFTDKQTDIAGLVNELEVLYSNRNVGAIIIASDGMYNKGMNPLYASGLDQLDAPLYTLALGDTSLRKDLVVQKVAHNQLAYLGNDFPIEVMINAAQCKGEQTQLRVIKEGKVIRSVAVEVKNQSLLLTVPFVLNAEQKGTQHYQIELAPVSNEISTINNYMDIYIDVLDNRQQVLVLADGPHPDISAVRSAIEANKNYELEMVLATDKRHPVFKTQEACF